MNIALKLLWFILSSAIGFLGYGVTVNVLIVLGILESASVTDTFGAEMTAKVTWIWLGSALLAFISVFLTTRWRLILLLAPIFAPIIFTIAFVLTNTAQTEIAP